jgi:hypothetical protein
MVYPGRSARCLASSVQAVIAVCSKRDANMLKNHMSTCKKTHVNMQHLFLMITLHPCRGAQYGLDGRPSPLKKGAAVIIDSPL